VTGKEAARLFVTVGADTTSFTSGMQKVQGSLNQTAGAVQGTMGMFKQFALGQIVGTYALQGLNAAIGFAKDSIIGFNATLEQATIGFTTMLGSGEAAQGMLNDLKKFAAQTPFRFEGLLDSSKRLLAMGYAAEDIIPIMTTVGDAVAGLGAGEEGISRATYALGQMKTAGRILSQDMMQLTSLGVPAWQYLADAVGGTTAEVRKMVEQGLIPAEDGIQAILAGMKEDFGGLMAKQSVTFAGAMSNIADMLQQIVATGFEPLFNEISKAAVALAAFLQSAQGIEVMNNLKEVVSQVVGVIKTIGPVVLGAVGAFFGFVAANPWIMGVVGALIAMRVALFTLSIIGGVVGWIQGLILTLGALRTAFLVNGISGFVATLGAAIPSVGLLTGALTGAATAAWGFAAAMLANPLTWIVLAIIGVTAAVIALTGAYDTAGEQGKRSAEMQTEAWRKSHGYVTGYQEDMTKSSEQYGYAAGYGYGAYTASGIYESRGVVKEAATTTAEYVGTESSAAMRAQGYKAGAAFMFGTQKAFNDFRAGERDMTSGAADPMADWEKRLKEMFGKLNSGSATSGVKKISLAQMFKSAIPELRALGGPMGKAMTDALGKVVAAVRKAGPQVSKAFKPYLENFIKDLKGFSAAVEQETQRIIDSFSSFADITDLSAIGESVISSIAPENEVTTVTKNLNGLVGTINEVTRKVETASEGAKSAGATYQNIIDSLKQKLIDFTSFAANIKSLQAMGLSPQMIEELIGAGVQKGGEIAAALAAGGKAAVDEVNALRAALDAQIKGLSSSVAKGTVSSALIEEAKKVANAGTRLVAQAKGNYTTLGKALVQGIIAGLNGSQGLLTDRVTAALREALNSAAATLSGTTTTTTTVVPASATTATGRGIATTAANISEGAVVINLNGNADSAAADKIATAVRNELRILVREASYA
jgi:tape measure domain-containing protein